MSAPPPSRPPPTSSYLKIKKEEHAKVTAAPRPYMASAAAAVDVEQPPARSRSAGHEITTGWPVVQPDPYPPYVTLSERRRIFLCPDAFACGPLCTRLPLYLCLGLLIGPLVLLLGIGITALLLLALTFLWYPLGVALSWLFPRGWLGFSPPTTLVWKTARIFQTLRSALWQQPRPGEWREANLAEQAKLSTALLHYAVNIQVPLTSEDELATLMGRTREVPPSNMQAVDAGFGPTNLLFSVPPDAKIDDLETFAPDEDPVAYVMDSLTCASAPLGSSAAEGGVEGGGGWPITRRLQGGRRARIPTVLCGQRGRTGSDGRAGRDFKRGTPPRRARRQRGPPGVAKARPSAPHLPPPAGSPLILPLPYPLLGTSTRRRRRSGRRS
jgi:hypothetical protein